MNPSLRNINFFTVLIFMYISRIVLKYCHNHDHVSLLMKDTKIVFNVLQGWSEANLNLKVIWVCNFDILA